MAIRLLLPYRKNVSAVTTDSGSEFACHKKIAKALGSTVYFAAPYAPWQKKKALPSLAFGKKGLTL